MHHQKSSPAELKSLIRSLRTLPKAEPPENLTRRIMASLPRRGGFLGRLEYAFTRNLYPGAPATNTFSLLPTSPPEYGMTLLSAGVFFSALFASLLIGFIYVGTGIELSGPVLAMAPALSGAVLLVLAGWAQLKSPHEFLPRSPRLAIIGILFALTAALGALASGPHIMNMLATWLGVSGLIVTLGLILVRGYTASSSLITHTHNHNHNLQSIIH